jgi:hypothetical protein
MNRIYLTAPLALGCALGACSGSDETTIPDALVASTLEAAGTNCEFGGTALAFGLDDNGDGVLQDAEVDSRSYVCDGATPDPVDAPAALVTTAEEPAGANCAVGGIAVSTGVDVDGNGALDASEVAATSYICAAELPDPGVATLTRVADEPAGVNCEFGGGRDRASTASAVAQIPATATRMCANASTAEVDGSTMGSRGHHSSADASSMAPPAYPSMRV